jgi:5'-3' exonuclease
MIALVDGDVLLYQAIWGTEDVEEAKLRLDEVLQAVIENTFCDDYLIAIGGPNNWREEFFSEYKKSPSRLASKKNRAEHFDALKDIFCNYPNAVVAHGFEADDLIRIWALQAIEAGDQYVVCTIDKDLDCIPGNHFKPGRDEHYKVSEDEADVHYWRQILTGDAVDNIPGLNKVGPVKANKILEGCDNNKKRKAAVINAYKEHYGDQWKPYLLANGRLIHIWRYINDHFQIKEEV